MLRSYLSRAVGLHRRQKGFYDKATLRRFAAAWASTGSPADLLYYASFRRDLGQPLPARWVDLLRSALPDFSVSERRLALGLLVEAGADCVSTIDPHLLSCGLRLPAIASRAACNTMDSPSLARIDQCQTLWRRKFSDYFGSAISAGGAVVIGNAATLVGLRAGGQIDQCGLVVRFNHFMGRSELIEDVGSRTDVWVVSPGYKGPVPKEVSWIVMTGPDMRYRLGDWRHVMPLVEQGIPLLTIPLAVWGKLVRLLKAPPSAGVLVLAWLNSLAAGEWQGVSIAGIGSGLGKGGRYHASLSRHMASGRHAWKYEMDLVEKWRQSGLSIVSAGTRGVS